MPAQSSESMIANFRSAARLAIPGAMPANADPLALIVGVRQDFLNALPIAAAIVCDDAGSLSVSCQNRLFEDLYELGHDGEGERISPLARPALAASVHRFLASGRDAEDMTWTDGGRVGARYFVVRMARLRPLGPERARCLVTMVDRTAEVETERSLRAEMLHDSLTGLPNRVAFGETVEAAIASAPENTAQFAVVVVDLARFSRINESMGSIAGDELIITVARRLVSALRSGDTLARIGGDEFGILLRLVDGSSDALHATRRIHAALSTPFRLSDLEIRIDCAVGCALMNDRVSGSEDLVRGAQFALKRAKVSGRVEVYQPGEVNAARDRFSLETELRRALDKGELTLAFQPIIELRHGRVAGFEALARWHHPERGNVPPSEFIGVAEECGLIVPLGRWAIETAVATMKAWDRALGEPIDLPVAVNVSAIQLARDDVSAAVADALARHGLPGRRLKLEITESAIVRDPEHATRALEALKAMDVQIAMDDFGTGYSSLAYLQKLPIDVLKIDRSFVTGMLGDRDSVAIVRAVLGLADALGMETTAEGIETLELAQALAALGCTYGQGYHFARPLPADDALVYLRARSA